MPRLIGPFIVRVRNHLAETFVDACRSTERLDDAALAVWEALQRARCLSEVVTPCACSDGCRRRAPVQDQGADDVAALSAVDRCGRDAAAPASLIAGRR